MRDKTMISRRQEKNVPEEDGKMIVEEDDNEPDASTEI